MKLFNTFFACIVLSLAGFSQAWNEVDASAQALGGFTSITEHNDKLFAISYNKALVVSTDGGNSFTDITTDTLFGQQVFVGSAGNRLYVNTWRALQQQGYIYYSEDEGASWTMDSMAGLPVAASKLMTFITYDNDHILAQFQGNDNYFKRGPSDNLWSRVDTFYNNSNDPLLFTGSNDTALAITPLDVQYSLDNGANWTKMAGAGLSNYYNVHGFDFEEGRIYFVEKLINSECKLFYSDDFGVTFDTVSLAAYFGKNQFGQDQLAFTLKAVGNQVWISQHNEQSQSQIDMLVSNDRGATWQYDTIGLHVDAFGTDGVLHMMVHNNEIYALCALGKLYKKGLNNVGLPETNQPDMVSLFPNPASNQLFINCSNQLIGKELRVYAASGDLMTVQPIRTKETTLDLSSFSEGAYLLKVDGESYRFMKIE